MLIDLILSWQQGHGFDFCMQERTWTGVNPERLMPLQVQVSVQAGKVVCPGGKQWRWLRRMSSYTEAERLGCVHGEQGAVELMEVPQKMLEACGPLQD